MFADQLLRTSLHESHLSADDQDLVETGWRFDPDTHEPLSRLLYDEFRTHLCTRIPWEQWQPEKVPRAIYASTREIANIAYKSEKCPSHCNWDMWCSTSDLIFLDMVDE